MECIITSYFLVAGRDAAQQGDVEVKSGNGSGHSDAERWENVLKTITRETLCSPEYALNMLWGEGGSDRQICSNRHWETPHVHQNAQNTWVGRISSRPGRENITVVCFPIGFNHKCHPE